MGNDQFEEEGREGCAFVAIIALGFIIMFVLYLCAKYIEYYGF